MSIVIIAISQYVSLWKFTSLLLDNLISTKRNAARIVSGGCFDFTMQGDIKKRSFFILRNESAGVRAAAQNWVIKKDADQAQMCQTL